MLRIGLTGGLGSGKSAVALVWASAGVPVLEADALGRELMQPGEPVYRAIVEAFGAHVVQADGQLNRAALAREAFQHSRREELNAIVHPAVIAAQDVELYRLEARGEDSLAVVESALIFESSLWWTGEGLANSGFRSAKPSVPGWHERFDKLVLVAAPEAVRIERFVARAGGSDVGEIEQQRLRDDARRRIAAQLPDRWKRPRCDYVIENDRTLVLLRREALRVLAALRRDAEAAAAAPLPLK